MRLYDVLMVCGKCKHFYDENVKRVYWKITSSKPFLGPIIKKGLGLEKIPRRMPILEEVTSGESEGESSRKKGFEHVIRTAVQNSNPKVYTSVPLNAKNSGLSDDVRMQHPGVEGVELLMERPYLNAIEKFNEAAQGLGCDLPEEHLSVPRTSDSSVPHQVECPRAKLSCSVGKLDCPSEQLSGKEVDYGEVGLQHTYTILEVDCCSFCCNDKYKEEIIRDIRSFLNEGRPVCIREKVIFIM